MSLSPIQLYENFITCIQMKYDTVAGIIITLVLVLGNGAGPDLEYDTHTHRTEERGSEEI